MDLKTAIANLKHVTNGNDILRDFTIRLETNQAQPTSQHLSGGCRHWLGITPMLRATMTLISKTYHIPRVTFVDIYIYTKHGANLSIWVWLIHLP